MWENFRILLGAGFWGLLKAVLLIVLAFIVSSIVRSLVVKLINKSRLASALEKKGSRESAESSVTFIGKLTKLLVFLLFVPGIFASLGMENMTSPILGVLNTLWGYLPNVLAAGLILWVGLFIAKTVRELLVPIFGRLKINKLQEKAGIEVEESGKLSNTLAYIVYVLILVPVIITALHALNIAAVSEPAIEMLNLIFDFIPRILAAVIIIVVGCIIARFCGQIVKSLIASSGIDAKIEKHLDNQERKFVLSAVAGQIVSVLITIFFIVESFSVLKLDVLSGIGTAVIGYMPYILAAVLIYLACYLSSKAAEKALLRSHHKGTALLAKVLIYVLGGFMILSELGIAQNIVNTIFVLVVGALAVAFAISFGIGGKEFAKKALEKLEGTCGLDKAEPEPAAEKDEDLEMRS